MMICNYDDRSKDEPSRYIEFAFSYLKASIDVCTRMVNVEGEFNWANANVCLMLSAHSVELFLKGKLISNGNTDAWGHTIDELYQSYVRNFPDKKHQFDCLFVTSYHGFTDEEIKEMRNIKRPQPSVLYRYPVKKPSTEWDGIHGLMPEQFLEDLGQLKASYHRLTDED